MSLIRRFFRQGKQLWRDIGRVGHIALFLFLYGAALEGYVWLDYVHNSGPAQAEAALVRDCAGIAGQEGQPQAQWAYQRDMYTHVGEARRSLLPPLVATCVEQSMRVRCPRLTR